MKLSALHNKEILSAKKKSSKGFTLIELLVVIGILAVLLAITLIAINPARQFEQANNTQRASDVNAILNAVWQYAIQEESGSLTSLALPTTATEIGNLTGMVDLCPDVAPNYIAQLPVDPVSGSWGTVDTDSNGCPDEYNTGYTILQSTGGRVTISAPGTEPVESPNVTTNDITVSR